MYDKKAVLKSIRSSMKDGCTLSVAIHRAGVKSKTTIKMWRDKSRRIDRFIEACKNLSDDHRTDKVEDAFFNRLVSGQASPTDYIFYLTNRRPERWKHVNALVNVVNHVEANGQKIETPHAVIFSSVKDECKQQQQSRL